MAIKESPSASIAAEESQIAKAVLMPGDPLRAKYVADHYLEEVVCFNTVRNMLGYTGTYKGKRISVMGHGMGVPSMGIYSYELYQFFGVDTIIRIGSAGGIGDDVKVRDVVIALGASTNSHFADQYRFPGQLCATADFRLLRDAVETAEAMGVRADVGQVFTADQFYNDNSDAGAMYRKFGILALEMLKIIYLISKDGVYNDKQLIPADYIKAARMKQSDPYGKSGTMRIIAWILIVLIRDNYPFAS